MQEQCSGVLKAILTFETNYKFRSSPNILGSIARIHNQNSHCLHVCYSLQRNMSV